MPRSKKPGKMVPVYLKWDIYKLWLKIPKGERSAFVSTHVRARFPLEEVETDAG